MGGSYVLRRLYHLVPTLLGVITLTFLVVRLLPGDPALYILGENSTQASVDALRDQLNLGEPLPSAWLSYMGSLLTGDLGESIAYRVPVSEILSSVLPVTVAIATSALILGTILGVTIGAVAAHLASRGRAGLDHALTSTSIVLEGTPPFVVALIAMLFFVLRLEWFPAVGVIDWGDIGGVVERLAMPVGVLAIGEVATIGRITRTSTLDSLGNDYVRTARALGESSVSALTHHGLRNSLLPVITMVGLSFGRLLGGTIVIEVIFSLPGMGSTLIDGIVGRDYPVIQALVLVYALLYVFVNLLTDVLYRLADPRVEL